MKMRLGWMLAVFVSVTVAASAAVDPSLSAAANQAFLAAYDKKPGVVIKPDGLRYRILRNGYGRRPRPIDYVTVYYTGKLINGKVFDGTEEGMPVRFKVNTLISGWSEALSLMKVGARWEVVIPPIRRIQTTSRLARFWGRTIRTSRARLEPTTQQTRWTGAQSRCRHFA